MEKIKSGNALIYRKAGLPGTVLSFVMMGPVSVQDLQRALDTTLPRYPYFSTKLVEKDGDFYLAPNAAPMVVRDSSVALALGSEAVNGHLIDVRCNGETIYVQMHHALCDGGGVMPFCKTLLYYYCCIHDKKDYAVGNSDIRLADSPLLPDETTDPNDNAPYEVKNPVNLTLNEDNYVLPEIAPHVGEERNYRWSFRLDYPVFMEFIKTHDASPAVALSAFLSMAIDRVHPDHEKDIVCAMALNSRKALGLENTYKNCLSHCRLDYKPKLKGHSVEDICTAFRGMVFAQSMEDFVRQSTNRMAMLQKYHEQMKTYEEKLSLYSFVENFAMFSCLVSYVGRTELGECESQIKEMHIYGSSTLGMIIEIGAINESITFDLIQSFPEEAYCKELRALLEAAHIPYEVSEKIDYRIPAWKRTPPKSESQK